MKNYIRYDIYIFIFIFNFLFLIELILIYNIVRVMETY